MGVKLEGPPAKSPRERREARRRYAILAGLAGVVLTAVGLTIDSIPGMALGLWVCMAGVILFASPRQQPILFIGLGWFMTLFAVLWLAWDPFYIYPGDPLFVLRGLGAALAAAAALWVVTCGAMNRGVIKTYVQEAASGPCSAWASESEALEVRHCGSCGRMIWSLSTSCVYCGGTKTG